MSQQTYSPAAAEYSLDDFGPVATPAEAQATLAVPVTGRHGMQRLGLAAFALLLATPAAAEDYIIKAYDTTYLHWEPSDPGDPDVNGYFVFRQDGDEAAPLELVGMTRSATDTDELLTLPRCVRARFVVQEMQLYVTELRYQHTVPDVIVRTREPGPWMRYCGDPDLDADGVISIRDVNEQRGRFGLHLEGDEWVP